LPPGPNQASRLQHKTDTPRLSNAHLPETWSTVPRALASRAESPRHLTKRENKRPLCRNATTKILYFPLASCLYAQRTSSLPWNLSLARLSFSHHHCTVQVLKRKRNKQTRNVRGDVRAWFGWDVFENPPPENNHETASRSAEHPARTPRKTPSNLLRTAGGGEAGNRGHENLNTQQQKQQAAVCALKTSV